MSGKTSAETTLLFEPHPLLTRLHT